MGNSRIAQGIAGEGIGGRYLEVGSGPGVLTTTVAQTVPDVHITGLEISPDMITVAKEEVAREGLTDRITFVEGDATDPALLDQLGRFDLVYSTYTLHHWDDPGPAIETLLRAVAPGGTLFVHDLKRTRWLYWVPIRSGFFASIRAAYVPEEIRKILDEAGINRYEIKGGPFYYTIFIRV